MFGNPPKAMNIAFVQRMGMEVPKYNGVHMSARWPAHRFLMHASNSAKQQFPRQAVVLHLCSDFYIAYS
jgi:hypothetical protein